VEIVIAGKVAENDHGGSFLFQIIDKSTASWSTSDAEMSDWCLCCAVYCSVT